MSIDELHIIAVLYNSEPALPRYWECLRAQTFAAWRLIVVDNASADGSLAAIEAMRDERVAVLSNKTNEGFARAANAGFRRAAELGACFCLLMNVDTAFAPDFLDRFRMRWGQLSADIIAPRIMYLDAPEKSWYAGGHLDFGWTFSNLHEVYDPTDTAGSRIVDFASGCCLGVTTDVLRRVGVFDESFFVYWEDADFCLRLKAAGIPIVYVSEPFLLHEGGASSGGEFTPAHTRLYYRSYMQLLRKHFGWRYALLTSRRLLAKEARRPGAGFRRVGQIAGALCRGLYAPLAPPARL